MSHVIRALKRPEGGQLLHLRLVHATLHAALETMMTLQRDGWDAHLVTRSEPATITVRTFTVRTA